jgi:hypothetical protein
MLSMILDTDVVIDLQHEFPPAVAWYRTVGAGEAGIAVFVALEVVQYARNLAESRSATKIISPMPLVWPDHRAYAWAVSEFAQLHLGYGLSMVDVLVAATARSLDMPLCTFNVKHYRNIPDITTIQPYQK